MYIISYEHIQAGKTGENKRIITKEGIIIMFGYTDNITEQYRLLEELQEQDEQAFLDGNDLKQLSLYDDIVNLKKSILVTMVSSYSSGRIASIIGNTKYTMIDKAINKTLAFLFNAEEEYIYPLQCDIPGIEQLIMECYANTNL